MRNTKNMIKFTYEPDEFDLDITPVKKLEFHISDEVSFIDLVEEFKRFALACTYSTLTIEEYFEGIE